MGALQGAGGGQITKDDDEGIFGNFLLDETLDPGEYYVVVSGFDGVHLGAYELDIAFQPSGGQLNENILVNLEEPVAQEIASGVGNIRGWAVAPIPVRRVELYIDDVFASVVPYGGSRNDVAIQHPTLPNSDKSGFSQAFFYGNLDSELSHTARVVVVDDNGDFNEASATFNVLAFDEFVFRGVADLSGASVEVQGPRLIVRDFVLGQGLYDAELEFRTASQGFAIVSIQRIGSVARNAAPRQPARRAAGNAETSNIRINIEEPAQGSTYQGVSNIRGWALAALGIDRLEVFIDGRSSRVIPYGGSRQDVGRTFPQFRNPNDSGFSTAFNYGNLAPSEHSLRVVAYASDGSSSEATVEFSSARFDAPFIRDPAAVDLSRASAIVVEQVIALRDVGIDGVLHDLQLEFRKATQNFAIVGATSTLGAPVPAIVQPRSDTQILQGEPVTFSATATGGQPPLRFRWDFGDPEIAESTAQNPGPIVFDNAGTFDVSLSISDSAGRVSAQSASLTVDVQGSNRDPVVEIVAPVDGAAVRVRRSRVAFAAEANDPDGDPITLEWSFLRIGGGYFLARSDANPVLTFPDEAEGKVEVTVNATDGRGGSSADSITLIVVEPDEFGK